MIKASEFSRIEKLAFMKSALELIEKASAYPQGMGNLQIKKSSVHIVRGARLLEASYQRARRIG